MALHWICIQLLQILKMIRKLKLKTQALVSIAFLWLKAQRYLFSKYELPPGRLIQLYAKERLNRNLILQLTERYGPIFKGRNANNFLTCIVDLPMAHQFLLEFKNDMHMPTVNLESLFPKGFLRQLEGDDHKKYRSALIQGISPEIMNQNSNAHAEIAKIALKEYVGKTANGANDPEAYIETLHNISTGMLLNIFFGLDANSSDYRWVMEKYSLLGNTQFNFDIGEQQTTAFNEIRDFLLQRNKDVLSVNASSILGNMHALDLVDETSLGNLIYMVEMGRHDMVGLFRWMSKFASNHPEILLEIAREDADLASEEINTTRAFVLETLRLNQIERLIRVLDRDLHYNNFIIPKGSFVRICLWEAHKNPKIFPEPFAFRPGRFLETNFSLKEYAPFGIGHHCCPLAQTALRMSMILIKTIATHYQVEAHGDGPACRERSHWEPAKSFTVKFMPIQ